MHINSVQTMKQFKIGLLATMLLVISALVYGTATASPVTDQVSTYHFVTDVTPLEICQTPISLDTYVPIYRCDSGELPAVYILEAKVSYLGFDVGHVANRFINTTPLGYICISPQKAC